MHLRRLTSCALAAILLTLGAASFAAIETREINIVHPAGFAFHDPATGRLFVVSPGNERFQSTASYSVVEPDGQVTTTLLPGATNAVFSARWRTLAITRTSGNTLVLVDADSLARSSIATGNAPFPLQIAEATGKAYVAGANSVTQAPWLAPGTMAGTLTEVDLRTHAVRTGTVEGFAPRHVAIDPAGARAFLVGVNYMRTSEELAGFVRAFDTANLTPASALLAFGRRPEMVTLSSDGKSLFAVSHMDWTYPAEYAEMMRNVHAALYVLDTATMATRTIVLPDDPDLRLHSGVMLGSIAQGATPATVYVLDKTVHRLVVVDVPSATWREVPLEDFGRAIAYNAVTDKVLVTLPRLGNVGVFSAAGDRLDTVSIGSGVAVGEGPTYSITTDATGNAYATNGPAGLVSVLRPDAATAAAGLVNMTDLWWNAAEPGWGIFVDQQATRAFAALFVKEAGKPAWYVMSDGKRQSDGAFAGTLHRSTGPGTGNTVAVGSMRIAADSNGRSFLTYDVEGKAVAAPIERMRFAAASRTCGWAVGAPKSLSPDSNYTALWFDSKDPGWGMAVSHQGDTAFGVLFTHDSGNRPTWAAMSNGKRSGAATFAGDLHRVGPASGVEVAGSMRLDFSGATAGVLGYQLNGATFTRPIERMAFAPLVTDCASE